MLPVTWALSDLSALANQQGLTSTPIRRRRTKTEMLAEESEEVEIEKVSQTDYISDISQDSDKPVLHRQNFWQ